MQAPHRPHAGLSLSAAAQTQHHGVTKAQAVASQWPHTNLSLREVEAAWQQRPVQAFPSYFPVILPGHSSDMAASVLSQ